jgi:hypothetical protein
MSIVRTGVYSPCRDYKHNRKHEPDEVDEPDVEFELVELFTHAEIAW